MAGFASKFESAKQDWTTPQEMWDRLNAEFGFTIDLAADSENAKCARYFSKDNDALKKEWPLGIGWLNPPYGDNSGKLSTWVQKAFDETRKPGCTVVMLIPARTNTRWWHVYCMRASEIRLINGRPKFGNAVHGLPQPLALLVFSMITESPKLSSYLATVASSQLRQKQETTEASYALAV